MGFNPFKGVEDISKGLGHTGEKLGLGAHNSLLQGSGMTYGSATAWGASIGAAYGAVDGGMSYDGSIVGGAIHGAMLGAAGGAAGRFASETYAKGAIKSGTASTMDGGASFVNEWGKSGANLPGGNAFRFGNFSSGFFNKVPTP